MKDDLFEKTEREIEILRREASRVKDKVADVFDAAVVRARRGVRRSYQTAEDIVDDAALGVKRHPFASLAVSFGAGALGAWFVSRKLRGRTRAA